MRRRGPSLAPLTTRLPKTAPSSKPSIAVETENVYEHEILWKEEVVPRLGNGHRCANVVEYHRQAYNIRSSKTLKSCSYQDFLAEFAQHCSQCAIRRCVDPKCVALYRELASTAPPCKWIKFREWAITVMSCRSRHRLPFSYDSDFSLGQGMHGRPVSLASQPVWFLQGAIAANCCPPDMDTTGAGDIFALLRIIVWMTSDDMAQDSQQHSYHFDATWMYGTLETMLREREGYSWPPVHEAAETLSSIKICQKRIWDIAQTDPGQEFTLPSLVHLARTSDMDPGGRHHDCSPQVCHIADDSSTQKKQLHKCSSPVSCNQVDFDIAQIDANFGTSAENEYVDTAWSLDNQDQGRTIIAEPYMAISHVWSDGTGVGLQRRGIVNACLFDFFATLAREEGCEGLWWDTICLPTSRQAKRKALNAMHMIYHRAKFVLIHDSALANTVWKDDGSSCLALVLSDWFTRGWTALELWAGRIVKVLFRDGTGAPVLKDLDTEVLVTPSSLAPHLAHRIASTLVEHARTTQVGQEFNTGSLDLSQLLHLLRSRATSFVRDKMIVAGLMAGVPDLDPFGSPAQITKQMLNTQKRIETTLLLHDRVPMTTHGPWSWCPPSVLDLKPAPFRDVRFKFRMVSDGVILGEVYAYLVTTEIAKTLTPATTHVAGRLRVAGALRDWESCLLLQDDGEYAKGGEERKFILVTARDLAFHAKVLHNSETMVMKRLIVLVLLDCDYIGTVSCRVGSAESVGQIFVRLGCDSSTPRARDLPRMMDRLQQQTICDWDAMQLVGERAWLAYLIEHKEFLESLIQRNEFVTWPGWRDIRESDYL